MKNRVLGLSVPSFMSYIIMPSTGVLLHNNAITHLTIEEWSLVIFLRYNLFFWSILKMYKVNDMKIVCQICGVICYLQHIGKSCYGVRHYAGNENGRPVFKYHKQDPEYVLKLLEQREIDQIEHNSVDQNLKEDKPFNENMGGPVVQFGMNAAFARRRPRVQIPPGPHLTFAFMR